MVATPGRFVPARGRIAGLRSVWALGLVLLGMALAAAPAGAEFKGTPGKLAVVKDGLLELIDPVDGSQSPIDQGVADYAPSWSPDGTRVAYVKSVPDPGTGGEHYAVFVAKLDGSAPVQVTHPSAGAPDAFTGDWCPGATYTPGHETNDFAPTWAPDGRRIAFVRDFTGRSPTLDGCSATDKCAVPYVEPPERNIWTVDVGTGSEQRLTRDKASGQSGESVWYDMPAWSADGRIAARVMTYTGCLIGGDGTAPLELDIVTGGGGRSALPVAGDHVVDYDFSPDGKQLAVLVGDVGGRHVEIIDQDGKVTPYPEIDSLYRFSPDGNGLIVDGCVEDDQGQQRCGLVEHRLPDQSGDVRESEPLERYFGPDPQVDAQIPYAGGIDGSRVPVDVQPQHLPVIFLPGFLGSEIVCGNTVEWFSLFQSLASMALKPDGEHNAGCRWSTASGKLIRSVALTDIYGKLSDYVHDKFTYSDGASRGYLLGWDWRLDPEHNLTRLDDEITRALDTPEARAQGAARVVLFGHSYGGLLIRHFLSYPARADKVARVLTVGTPYWGSPKSIFPLAYGIETPLFSALDLINRNANMRALAQNLTGLYQLFPSDRYGPWLSLDNHLQTPDGVRKFIGEVGGNPTLWAKARANHQSTYDQFFDDGGRIDVRQVVGTGEPTIGAVAIRHNRYDPKDPHTTVDLSYVNGDDTVPATSAWTGPVGQDPQGDPHHRVHMQAVCGFGHVELASEDVVLSAYTDFLDSGHRPRRTGGPCPFNGLRLEFHFSQTLGTGSSAAWRDFHSRPAADGSVTIDQADRAGSIDVARLPGQMIVTTSGRRPVTLRIDKARSVTFTSTPISDAGNGKTLAYGPVSGTIRIAPARAGQYPTVTANGRAVRGVPASPRPPVLSRLRISPRTLTQRRPRRSKAKRPHTRPPTISYTDSQPARATITIRRQLPGIIRRGRCIAKQPHRRGGRRCTRYRTALALEHADHRGHNSLTIPARTLARLLPGSYRVYATATAPTAITSRTISTGFRVVPGAS